MEIIKILNPDDVFWKDYKELRLQALFEEPQAFGSSYADESIKSDEEWKKRLENYKKGEHNWMFFAQVDKKLVGMLGAFQDATDIEKREATIIAMFVIEEYRGKGIAKMLMQRILQELAIKKMAKVKINLNVDQTIALKMYEKFGFVVQDKVNYMMGDGKYHNEYKMEKMLVT